MRPGELPVADIVQLRIGQFAGAGQRGVKVLDRGVRLAEHKIATATTDVDDLDVRLRDAPSLRAQLKERFVQLTNSIEIAQERVINGHRDRTNFKEDRLLVFDAALQFGERVQTVGVEADVVENSCDHSRAEGEDEVEATDAQAGTGLQVLSADLAFPLELILERVLAVLERRVGRLRFDAGVHGAVDRLVGQDDQQAGHELGDSEDQFCM
uniref:Uncharacterized protein n=1 Tax=Aster yellows phytoplasma TaxID=35779 RepID=Q847U4_ASTYP|nr:hypothetical protein [Aster yellows phytoplasma]